MWRTTKLKPHRLDRYLASNDPEFESKAADIIGLYLVDDVSGTELGQAEESGAI